MEKESSSDLNISKSSISAFIELLDIADKPLTSESKSLIDQVKNSISNDEEREEIVVQLEANEPSSLKSGSIGEYIYRQSDISIELQKSKTKSNYTEMPPTNFVKTDSGLEKVTNFSGNEVTIGISEKRLGGLTSEETKFLASQGVHQAHFINTQSGDYIKSFSISAQEEESGSFETESNESHHASKSPVDSGSCSPNNNLTYGMEVYETKKETHHKPPRKDKKKKSNVNWVSLILIVIVVILVLVAIVWVLRNIWNKAARVTNKSSHQQIDTKNFSVEHTVTQSTASKGLGW